MNRIIKKTNRSGTEEYFTSVKVFCKIYPTYKDKKGKIQYALSKSKSKIYQGNGFILQRYKVNFVEDDN